MLEKASDRVVLFLHIPKTAGTSFNGVLDSMYPGCRHYFATGNGFKQLNGLARLSGEEIKTYGLVRGHMNYGAHKYFPDKYIYITFLRDPVARIVSHYKYLQANRYHPLHACYVKTKFTLRDFVSKTTDNDNGMTRALAGVANGLSLFEGKKVPFGRLSRGYYEVALRHLENDIIFGIQEEFDLSLLYFRRELSWLEYPFYASRNITPEIDDVSILQDDLDYVAKVNAFDIELYEKAREIFSRKIAPIRAELSTELPVYRQANLLHAEYSSLKTRYDDLVIKHEDLTVGLKNVERNIEDIWGKYVALADSVNNSRVSRFSRLFNSSLDWLRGKEIN